MAGRSPLDRSAGLTTGRRRAKENVPLPTVLAGYRIGVQFLWQNFVAEAGGAGDALVRAASAVWAIQDEITETMISGYRDATTERLLAREHERSALVEALLTGMTVDTADLWAAADVLRIPRRGRFAVVAAEVPEIGRQALPRVEALYCHPNTVRLRLRRIAEHTGRNLGNPREVSELCLALTALRQGETD